MLQIAEMVCPTRASLLLRRYQLLKLPMVYAEFKNFVESTKMPSGKRRMAGALMRIPSSVTPTAPPDELLDIPQPSMLGPLRYFVARRGIFKSEHALS